jgi:hypothetical protein
VQGAEAQSIAFRVESAKQNAGVEAHLQASDMRTATCHLQIQETQDMDLAGPHLVFLLNMLITLGLCQRLPVPDAAHLPLPPQPPHELTARAAHLPRVRHGNPHLILAPVSECVCVCARARARAHYLCLHTLSVSLSLSLYLSLPLPLSLCLSLSLYLSIYFSLSLCPSLPPPPPPPTPSPLPLSLHVPRVAFRRH